VSELFSSSNEQHEHWLFSEYAKHYFACERPHVMSAVRQAIGPSALQIGNMLEQNIVDHFDFPYLVTASCSNQLDVDLVADPAFLPIAADSFATVLLPHVLEGHKLPHQVLREMHRVLQNEGHIVLTGFNPFSLIGCQRWINKRAVFPGRYYTPGRVMDWLQLLGFEVVASAMFQYAPLSKSKRLRTMFNFLESAGDRWLPMMGGGYMITAKKRNAPMTLVGKVKRKKPKRSLVSAVTPAKTSLHNK